jgi:hypothetical protein
MTEEDPSPDELRAHACKATLASQRAHEAEKRRTTMQHCTCGRPSDQWNLCQRFQCHRPDGRVNRGHPNFAHSTERCHICGEPNGRPHLRWCGSADADNGNVIQPEPPLLTRESIGLPPVQSKTLRDEFVIAALPMILRLAPDDADADVAQRCYRLADAMMKARNARNA